MGELGGMGCLESLSSGVQVVCLGMFFWNQAMSDEWFGCFVLVVFFNQLVFGLESFSTKPSSNFFGLEFFARSTNPNRTMFWKIQEHGFVL